MGRLVSVAVLLAVIVPTALLGGGSAGFVFTPRSGYSSVRQVERAFAAERIALKPTLSPYVLDHLFDLAGRGPSGFRPRVEVYIPRRYSRSGPTESVLQASIVDYSSSSEPPVKQVSVVRGNVKVSWLTTGPWRAQTALVRAALDWLRYPAGAPVHVFCLATTGRCA